MANGKQNIGIVSAIASVLVSAAVREQKKVVIRDIIPGGPAGTVRFV